MSKINDLRTNKQNNINLVSIIETFITDTKYIVMYKKLLNELIYKNYSLVNVISRLKKLYPFIDTNKVQKLNDLELLFLSFFLEDLTKGHTTNFSKFMDFNERKLISKNDLQSYTSFNEINTEVKKAEKIEEEKTLEKQVKKLIDNDEWLILLPLSYKASLKYGSSTKWCTASKDNDRYFKEYTNNGVLIYLINKKNNKKFAIHKIPKEITTFWDDRDNEVDFFTLNINIEEYNIVKDLLQSGKKSKDFFIEIDDVKQRNNELVHKYVDNYIEISEDTRGLISNSFENGLTYDSTDLEFWLNELAKMNRP